MGNWESLNSLGEVWAPAEASVTLSLLPLLISTAPKGDGHAVVVLPGFATGREHTLVMRSVLNSCGYDARDWGQGCNRGPSDEMDCDLIENIMDIYNEDQQKVSLVGWSLGGLYARSLAQRYPDVIRSVVTLGSPHRADPRESQLSKLYDQISPTKVSEVTDADLELVSCQPLVPTTSIYTRTDGVVNWKDCINDESPLTENVEVTGSHWGLVYNFHALGAVLEALSKV
jgi:pimeloyl-ACP methyl ester carboxylesterase